MREKVNFKCKGLGNIEIWEDQIKNLQTIEESNEWSNLHGGMFQSRVNFWTTKMLYPNYSYRCKHFEIHYKINEEGSLRITDVKF
jgi:hypothetical protein